MSQDLRNRFAGYEVNKSPGDSGAGYPRRKGLPYLKIRGIAILLYLVFLYFLALWFESRLPDIVTIENAGPGDFVGQRAKGHLDALAGLGPKPTGSHENEVMAVNYILHWLTNIKNLANAAHSVEIDLQKTTGCFNILLADKFTSCYANVQNIVVKVGPKSGSNDALLINCHFDSVPSSPGASDDVISCAMMLEVLQVITEQSQPLKNSLIFLFNGAEENILQASHGFITQHKWRNLVKAFINLEACGAGGREVLFQSGPNYPWLLKAYKNGAKWPFASVIGQELFQSGVIPSDTDFRIFRDFGNLSGLDVAFVKNGYVYHTKFDTPEQIPPGSIQRAGENLLGVVKYIGNSSELGDSETPKFGKMVYYDILGIVMVLYPEGVANIINIMTVALSLIMMVKCLLDIARESAVARTTIMFQFGVVVFGILLSWITGLLTNICLAKLIEFFECSLKWYGQPILIVGLYVCPALLAIAIVQKLVADHQSTILSSVWHVADLHIEAVRFIFLILLITMAAAQLQSNYILMQSILLTVVIRNILCKILLRRNSESNVYLYCLSLALPFLTSSYMVYQLYQVFVPIMGRIGGDRNPEIFIAVVSSMVAILMFAFFTPLLHIVRDRNLLCCLTSLIWIVFTVLSISNLTFPYSGDQPHPRPQRFLILHTERTFMKALGELDYSESGYWIMDLDINSPNSVREHVPDFTSSRSLYPDCDKYLYCGAPYYYPILSHIKKTTWIPGPKPEIYLPVSVNGAKVHKVTDVVRKISFNVTGPDHMGVILSPSSQAKMLGWSLTETYPVTSIHWKDGRPIYFIYFSYGVQSAPLSFHVDFQVRPGYKDFLADVAVTGHNIHGPNMKSPGFVKFLQQFPDWVYATGWTSSYLTFSV